MQNNTPSLILLTIPIAPIATGQTAIANINIEQDRAGDFKLALHNASLQHTTNTSNSLLAGLKRSLGLHYQALPNNEGSELSDLQEALVNSEGDTKGFNSQENSLLTTETIGLPENPSTEQTQQALIPDESLPLTPAVLEPISGSKLPHEENTSIEIKQSTNESSAKTGSSNTSSSETKNTPATLSAAILDGQNKQAVSVNSIDTTLEDTSQKNIGNSLLEGEVRQAVVANTSATKNINENSQLTSLNQAGENTQNLVGVTKETDKAVDSKPTVQSNTAFTSQPSLEAHQVSNSAQLQDSTSVESEESLSKPVDQNSYLKSERSSSEKLEIGGRPFQAVNQELSEKLTNQMSELKADVAKTEKPETSQTIDKIFQAKTDNSSVSQFQQINNLLNADKTQNTQLNSPINIHSGKWHAAMTERVTWLANQNIQAADIQLDPPELGPLQVRIHLHNDQTSVNFVSQHASVRDTIESQLVRLKELFNEEGLNLVDVNVSDQRQGERQTQDQHNSLATNQPMEDANSPESTIPLTSQAINWVDYYV